MVISVFDHAIMQIKYQDAIQAAAVAQEQQIRQDANRAFQRANLELAEARRLRDEAARVAEEARSNAELAATISDPYLTEDPRIAASALSPYRSVPCPLTGQHASHGRGNA